jgi:ATP-binding cassette subfamily B protein
VLIKLLKSHLILPYRRLLLLLLCLQFVQAATMLILPTLNARVIDDGVLTGDTGYIWRVGAVMLGVALVGMIFQTGAIFVASRAAMRFGRDVRSDLFHRVTSYSQREVNEKGSPSLINRITNDVQQVQMLAVMVCTMALQAPLTAIGGIILALREDAGLSALLLVSLPVLVVLMFLLISRLVPTFRSMQDRIDAVNQVLREQIIGMRVVRAFVREPEETERFEAVNTELTGVSLKAGRLMAAMMPIVLLIVNCSSTAVIWFGASRIDSGELTIGAMVAFLSYFTIILMSIMSASFVLLLAPRAAVSAERIVDVLETETSVRPPAQPVTRLHGRGTLEMRDVRFGYPGAEAPVLEGVTFTSRPDQTTAIIGGTGSGKSTLLNLVPRLMDVTSGSVLIDGVDVRDLDPDELWKRVGLVPQKPYLFTGSVADNLRYGRSDATEEEMWDALRVSQAADFVEAMGGLEAQISQGGSNVSGGQRQRLSIARAVIRQPEVYLFDDSFSALDLATDARLRAALAPWTRGATVVVVAQRVSTIVNADQIIVLEDGEMVGIGTHTDLLAHCPTYAEIVDSQTKQQEAA